PMGFYAPAQIVRDAQEHGVEMRAVDINHSDWDNTLEPTESVSPSPLEGEGGSPRSGETDGGRRLHARHAEMAADIRTTHAMRLGLRQISGFGEDDAKTIMDRRGRGYDSVRDLWLRTSL